MKKLIIIVLLLGVCAGLVWKYAPFGIRDLQEDNGLKIYGTIEIRDAGLAFKEQERLTELMVEEGDRVKAGQILAKLDTERLDTAVMEMEARIGSQQELVRKLKNGSRPQEIEQARAEVEAAQVRVDNLERILARLQKTVDSGASSRQDVDDALASLRVEKSLLKIREKSLNLVLEGPREEDIAAAESQLKALEASLDTLRIRVKDMTLVSPSDGIIQNRILEKGEMAGPGTPVFNLALTGTKWVRAYVPEPFLGRVKNGMAVGVLSDSFPGQIMEAQVGYISPIAEFTPRAIQTEELRTKLVYEVRIIIEDETDRLRLGMPVTVLVVDNPKQRS